MIVQIYPKLNIFLKIIGHKEGFHQLNSRFVQARNGLCDVMELKVHSTFVLKGDFGCSLEENLIFKAKCAMRDFLTLQGKNTQRLESLQVEVQKSIPQGAGLGGGSANAGAFLRAANVLCEYGLSENELIHIAQKVGADVSFFASGAQSANVCGRGENIESFAESPTYYEIHTPDVFCDTKKVYQCYAKAIKNRTLTYSAPTYEWFRLTSKDLLCKKEPREAMNDLFVSATLEYPALKSIARELGSEWYFSGSGSSFFRLRA